MVDQLMFRRIQYQLHHALKALNLVLLLVKWKARKRESLVASLLNSIHIHNFQFSRAVRGENFLYGSGGGIVNLHLSQWAVYRIVAIDVRSRREGRDLRKVGFYDPIKNQTYLNVPAILYFLEKGAQPTGTVHDISKRAAVFTEFDLNQ